MSFTPHEQMYLATLDAYVKKHTTVSAWATKTQINIPTMAIALLLKQDNGITVLHNALITTITEILLQSINPAMLTTSIIEWQNKWQHYAKKSVQELEVAELTRMLKQNLPK